jgi:hypothetical protein
LGSMVFQLVLGRDRCRCGNRGRRLPHPLLQGELKPATPRGVEPATLRWESPEPA